ncbi:hypothetical protein I6A84_40565 [Frankia sp. CNm7]|uniref:Uncharacterized protein n=1 Tax=Frankia nepalensis TaxID=1836974 RepID=A0A937RD76_9ACTN|nr:hypothetical protein [Frankia nepalensis]MBL7495896.1 hypothetical protein [Frankia nepalensis]MBL7510377.1 hypothetical protein [Frankia nepalensis]MBL7524169.1 hypothetical protein [Frankia nepalensis]MBL7629976.1 hypothetical protein [Frankia nepalensis]
MSDTGTWTTSFAAHASTPPGPYEVLVTENAGGCSLSFSKVFTLTG